jgi:predicted nucleotidyltransferase
MNPETFTKKISQSIKKKEPTAQVFLFGSRARGDYKKNSDWDILILVDTPFVTNYIEDELRDPLYDIELETGEIISTFIYSKKYWNEVLKYSPLFENIEIEGKLL